MSSLGDTSWQSFRSTAAKHPIQFSSVAQSCPTLSDPMDWSTPGLPVHHQLQEFTQTHVHWVSDAIQPSHPLSSPSPPAFNPSQGQGLFKWVSSSHPAQSKCSVNGVCVCVCVCVRVHIHAHPQSCLTLCGPMDCRPPGSSVHRILQARILDMGCHFLLWRIFPTHRSKLRVLHLLHWQSDSLPQRHLGSPQ